MRVAIVGFGLIGGSVARALRRSGGRALGGSPVEIVAWSRSPAGPAQARTEGVIDEAATTLESALRRSDLVVLAAPPLACLDLIDELGGSLGRSLADGATVTDVASTKAAIVGRADHRSLPFVGGHPMAGLERSGYRAAVDDLFVDRPWVVCPGAYARPEDVARVEALAVACGALPLRLEPIAHDAATASISHIPLVLSAALVEATTDRPGWPLASGLAAGGWRDMSRLATGDPAMGAGIAATNAGPIAAGLRDVRIALDRWIAELEAPEPDAERLLEAFEAARDRLGPPDRR